MRIRVHHLVAVLGIAATVGCRPRGTVQAPPDIPLVLINFDRHLETARHCSHRGVTNNPQEAEQLGANLILVFYGVTQSSTSTSGGIKTTIVKSGFWGQALRCPQHVVTALRGVES